MSESNLEFMQRATLEAQKQAEREEKWFNNGKGFRPFGECSNCQKIVRKLRGKRCMNGYISWFCYKCYRLSRQSQETMYNKK